MTETATLGVAVALVAGLLSFLSPCVLPLVPSYLGFITGMTAGEFRDRRRAAVLHALLFVLGFTVIFLLLGAGATALGRGLRIHHLWLERAGGVLIILFGLMCLGVFRMSWINLDLRVHLEHKPLGYLGSFVVGMAFGAGWTPCIGPVLGAILGLASTQESLGRGMVLLGAYSAGLAIPFLLAAFALEAFLQWFQRFRRFLPLVQRASGALLIFAGLLLVSGEFTRLSGWLQGLTPEFLQRWL
ncbi:MAG TPA: cytochrome c biogenesis protein CcdA [Gemmatimonadales bacterium]|jgi:cytochrome c-type biogenesis protein|nr:cytochrome c biogenesis protein CcdA [Gemmatimonadales bacterium]